MATASTCCNAANLPERRGKERIRIQTGRAVMTIATRFSPATPDPKISPDFSHDDFTSVSAAAFRSGLFAAFLLPVPSVPSLGSISVPGVAGHRARSRGTGRAPGRRAPPPGTTLNGRSLAPPLFLISANPRPACCNSRGGSVPLPQEAGEQRQRLRAVGENRWGMAPILRHTCWFPVSFAIVPLSPLSTACPAALQPPLPAGLPFSQCASRGAGRGGGFARAVGGAAAAAARAAKVRARHHRCTRPSRGGQGRAGPGPLLCSLSPLWLSPQPRCPRAAP